MIFNVVDAEMNGLHEATSIHCISYQTFEYNKLIKKGSLRTYPEMVEFLLGCENIVGHNFVDFDKPVIEKILGIVIPGNIIDSLALSYYLFPFRPKHGLESWGITFGNHKVEIEDWVGLSQEEYVRRCEIDVEINSKLFLVAFNYLFDLYGNIEEVMGISLYVSFKMECLKDQREVGIPLNIEKTQNHLNTLLPIFEEKIRILQEVMPAHLGKLVKKKPTKMFTKDGGMSQAGIKWITYITENNLPHTTTEIRDKPNPNSVPQLKAWLFILGWEPMTFKTSDATKEEVPQINLPFGQGLCPSVSMLFEVEEDLIELDNFFKVRHRIGIFNGYLETVVDGKVVAGAAGFTNTMRMTHKKPIANLPKPGVYYGYEIRECLEIPDDSYMMIGSDVSGLEDNTKQHYIYPYDPQYVEDMRVPGFDPHIDIGVLAGLITKEEEELFKELDGKEDLSGYSADILAIFASTKKKRGVSKVTNFSATYGAGPPKISKAAKIPLAKGEELHTIYWKRNWAVKEVAKACTVKVVNGQKWLLNPVSGFWLYLKAEKDRFSTLNQNTGVFVFDSWVHIVRQKLKPLGIKICLQYHDEILLYFKKIHEDIVVKILKESMDEVNKKLKLNVDISVSVDKGTNYAECH